MSTEEEGLSPMVADAFVRLALHVAALAVTTQHAGLEVLQRSRNNFSPVTGTSYNCREMEWLLPCSSLQ